MSHPAPTPSPSDAPHPEGSPATFSLERRLPPAQAARRDRMRDAARALAAEGGGDAVTMQAVAERAGVARATVYRYFAGKDHLLAEVTAAWGRDLIEGLRRDPPRGARHRRVAAVFLRVLKAARAEPRLASAVLASATSPDPEAVRAQARFASLIRDYLDVALGDGADAETRERLETVMGHVFFSAVVHMTAGRIDHADAVRALETAARLASGGTA